MHVGGDTYVGVCSHHSSRNGTGMFSCKHLDNDETFFYLENHYAPVNQANWCNMSFTAGNLFPSHSCIRWSESSPDWDLNPGPLHERQTTYQLCYPSPYCIITLQKHTAISRRMLGQIRDQYFILESPPWISSLSNIPSCFMLIGLDP